MLKERCFICTRELNKAISLPNNRSIFICPACRLRSLRPLPGPQEIDNIYNRQEYYTADMPELHDSLVCGYNEDFTIIKLYKSHLKKIIDFKFPPAELLEIGCARGVFLDLARKSGYLVTGTEMSSYAVDYAVNKFNLNVKKLSVEEINFKPESFDVIVALDVVEHLSHPEILFEKARQLLKPKGLLLIGTPNADSLINFLSEKIAILTKNKLYYPIFRFYGRGFEHFNIFNPTNLTRLLERYAFEVKETYGYNIPAENICDAGLLYKLVFRCVTIFPYEFVLMAEKKW